MDATTNSERDKKVSHWAYRIWLAEGQPEGRAEVHHRLAEAMVDMQEAEMAQTTKVEKPARKKAAASLKPNAQAEALVEVEDPKKSPGKPPSNMQRGEIAKGRKDALRPSPELKGKAVH